MSKRNVGETISEHGFPYFHDKDFLFLVKFLGAWSYLLALIWIIYNIMKL